MLQDVFSFSLEERKKEKKNKLERIDSSFFFGLLSPSFFKISFWVLVLVLVSFLLILFFFFLEKKTIKEVIIRNFFIINNRSDQQDNKTLLFICDKDLFEFLKNNFCSTDLSKRKGIIFYNYFSGPSTTVNNEKNANDEEILYNIYLVLPNSEKPETIYKEKCFLPKNFFDKNNDGESIKIKIFEDEKETLRENSDIKKLTNSQSPEFSISPYKNDIQYLEFTELIKGYQKTIEIPTTSPLFSKEKAKKIRTIILENQGKLWLLFFFLLAITLVNGFFYFKHNRKKTTTTTINPIFFSDIIGLDQAKDELREIITFFENPNSFKKEKISIPKGFLFFGPPGNGKTILASSLANECGVGFIFASGPEFEEVYHGLGALRIRELFSAARSFNKGCIIFIDEIESIAFERKSSRESINQTTNQLLVELSGIKQNDKIFFLAATNYKEKIDPAFLRPGRLDRHIYIGNPDFETRKKIILKQIEISTNFIWKIDVYNFAWITSGTNSASVISIMNEAKFLALREKKKEITEEEISSAWERVIIGITEQQNLETEALKICSVHESGHALIGLYFPCLVVKRTSVGQKSAAIGGYTIVSFRSEKELMNKKKVFSFVASLLGGRAAEEVIFGKEEVTSGPEKDLYEANALLDKYIKQWDLSDLGFIDKNANKIFLLSEKTKLDIEKAKKKILENLFRKAKRIISRNKKKLLIINEELLKRSFLTENQLLFIFLTSLPLDLKFIN